MFTYLSAGVVLGLSAGFSPGPLLMLVITQTLRHGIREGVKVALSPLFTDLPIIFLSLFVLSRLSGYRPLLGMFSVAGACLIVYLAWETFHTGAITIEEKSCAPRSLGKGTLVNLLSPHPWLFWLTVGAPFILKGAKTGPAIGATFAVAFLGCLVGAKIVVAVVAGNSRRLLQGKAYLLTMRILGVLLCIYAFMLLREGVTLFG